jgi:hypothetical protein
MASVMNKFVHCPSADERRCALLCADEVDRQQQYQTAKDRPRQELSQGNDWNRDWLGDRTDSELSHVETSGDHASQIQKLI